MTVAKVEARNTNGDLLVLELEDVSDGLVVTEIDGLGPVKASVISSNFAQLDGTDYQNSSRAERNIVIKLALEPDYVSTSVYDLRDRLYNFFMTEAEVALRLYLINDLVVDTVGRVEDFDPKIFTQEPSVDISILCFDPDFIDITPVEIDGNTVSTSTETTVAYPGTSPVGFLFTLEVDRTLSAFTLYHRAPGGSLYSMDVAGSFVAGDIVRISTVNRQKYATLTRSGMTTSLLNGVSVQSTWFQLVRGNNTFRAYATGAAIPYTVEYTPRYGGL